MIEQCENDDREYINLHMHHMTYHIIITVLEG